MNISLINIRGTGNNSLVLDALKIRSVTPNQTLRVLADAGDKITFGEGWSFAGVETVDGRLQRTFQNDGAMVHVIGPLDWTNPYISGDVNGSGDVTAGDALDVLFSLNQPQLFNSQGMLVDAATVSASNFRFYDTNEDGTSTAADALFVINVLFLQSLASGEGESVNVRSALIASDGTHSKRDSESATDYSLDTETEVVAKFVKIQSVVQATKRVAPLRIDDAGDDTGVLDDDLSGLDDTLAAVWDWIE